MAIPSGNPALIVELGAVFVLAAAIVARTLSRRVGIPSIVTLLGFGLLAGPSGIGLLHLDLMSPGPRALLSLAVVIVLFEVTLRVDLRHTPKVTIGLLAALGAGLVLLIVPIVARSFAYPPLVASLVAAICVVTGPTVIGPLMARLRPRAALAHLLETEGLLLDAIGVIIAAVTFASFTTRPTGPIDAAWHAVLRVAFGVAIGIGCGFAGRYLMRAMVRASSDIVKLVVLLLGIGTYALAELVSHESGLSAVVACGLLVDLKSLPHERLLRSFKEDLSMLALSTVFVLMASQIRVQLLGPQLLPALGIVATLVGIRVVSVLISTVRTPIRWGERVLMAAVFPRGIVAVSLAIYYATQIPAWGLHGGDRLAGVMFLVIIMTIVISTVASVVASRAFRLQMPSLIIAGITPASIASAQRLRDRGHVPVLVDTDDAVVMFARSNDLDAEYVESGADLNAIARERKARAIIVEEAERWRDAIATIHARYPILRSGSDEERRFFEEYAS
ncbi:MAG: cation:proton antiporter [bacterium]|nr:cation:proton antiporter [bacterium]